MADDELLAVIGICLAIFIFLVVLLAIGQYFPGTWGPVVEGVTKFIFLITIFGLAVYVLVRLVGRR